MNAANPCNVEKLSGVASGAYRVVISTVRACVNLASYDCISRCVDAFAARDGTSEYAGRAFQEIVTNGVTAEADRVVISAVSACVNLASYDGISRCVNAFTANNGTSEYARRALQEIVTYGVTAEADRVSIFTVGASYS